MLKERTGVKLDSGEETIITVQEILEEYEIDGLSLDDLQEKYVNMTDNYEEKIDELEEKNQEMNEQISNLTEKIEELTTTIEDPNNYSNTSNNDVSSNIEFIIIMFIVFIIGIYISYQIGLNKK